MRDSDQPSAPVFLNPDDDAEMEQAFKRARQTFRFFWRELAWEYRRIIPALGVACVKVAFSDPPDAQTDRKTPSVEQMWISDIEFDGQHVFGTLINKPNWLTTVHEGDHVKIRPTQVNDWMYSINDKVFGAYTVNLMRSRMGRKERADHDAAWGLDFGSPDDIRIVPSDYVNEKAKPGGFFSRLKKDSTPTPTVAEVAAKEHPMAINMKSSFEEFLKEDPTAITTTDDRGFTMLHQLALAGATGCVELLLKHGADPNGRAKNGLTPLQLAKSLGWKQTIAVLEACGNRS